MNAKKNYPMKSSVHDYFILSEDGKNYLCQCEIEVGKMCETKISSFCGKQKNAVPTRTFNLKRHLSRNHPEVMKIVDEKDKLQTAKSSTSATTIQHPTKSNNDQQSISSFFK